MLNSLFGDNPNGEALERVLNFIILAFEISIASLHGAVIGEKKLNNPIEISRHQHRDLMVAFCQVDKLHEAYTRLIAIIYETLAYEFNDKIRYKPDELLK